MSEVVMRTRSIGWILRLALGVAVVGAVVAAAPVAHAQPDPRGLAREHYQAGKQLYDAGKYAQAIAEFTQADQLAPSGVNEFNIALCYDKLNDAPNALAHYQQYLVRVPDAANKAQVEASIAKFQAIVAEQAAAKKAADEAAAKKAADEAAKKAADDAAKKAADDAAAQAAKKAADEAAAAAAAQKAAEDAAARGGTPPAGPATTRPAPTGDPDLDRVAAVDINAIRDQRGLGAGAAAAPTGPAQAGTPDPAQATGGGPPVPEKPAAKPVYKKWWFWAIVGVGALVAINLMSQPTPSTQANTARLLPPSPGLPGNTAGVSVLHW